MSENSSVNWGGLTKDILAGAAIVAGACIVFPGLAGGLVAALAAAGTALGAATSGAFAAGSGAGIGILLTKAFGVALAFMGASHFSNKGEDNAPIFVAPSESDASFAAREDMRKMQALMLMRMQAQGYQPAMATAPARQ